MSELQHRPPEPTALGTCVVPPTIQVTSNGDANAPLLQSVALSVSGVDVTGTLGVTDDLTGAVTVRINYCSTTSNQIQGCWATRTTGTGLNGTWSCTDTFSQFAAQGQWILQPHMYDAAGNIRVYTRRASDGFLCYVDPSTSQQVCQNFGTTDLILQ